MKPDRASLPSRLEKREAQLTEWLGRVFVLLSVFGERLLPGFVRRYLDKMLNRAAASAMELIFCSVMMRQAAKKSKGRKPGRSFNDPRARKIRLTVRASYGAALRRAFHVAGKASLLVRVEKIRCALANKEQLIARLARRLRHGLTRCAGAVTRVAIGADIVLRTLQGDGTITRPDTS